MGLASVTQSGLNKRLAEKAGLAGTLHISNLVVLIGGVVILSLVATLSHGEFSQVLKTKFSFRAITWWFLVPGLMGLFIITMAPYAIHKIGALPVFVAMIFGQVIGSAVWDYFIEGTPIDRWRVIGCALTLMGAVSVSFSKE